MIFVIFHGFLKQHFLVDDIANLADSIVLYTYQNAYYLWMSNISVAVANKLKFYAMITEFAKHVTNSKVFSGKLEESGSLLIGHNAFETGYTYFAKFENK